MEETVPEPTYTTMPGIESVSSSRVGYDCDCDHTASKGRSLAGTEGWDEDEVAGEA